MKKTPRRSRPSLPTRIVREWEFVTFRLPPELNAVLEAMAELEGEGKGHFLRQLVRDARDRKTPR